MKEIYGIKRAGRMRRIEREKLWGGSGGGSGLGEFGREKRGASGKVEVLCGGCALSGVAVWNHPGPCNS